MDQVPDPVDQSQSVLRHSRATQEEGAGQELMNGRIVTSSASSSSPSSSQPSSAVARHFAQHHIRLNNPSHRIMYITSQTHSSEQYNLKPINKKQTNGRRTHAALAAASHYDNDTRHCVCKSHKQKHKDTHNTFCIDYATIARLFSPVDTLVRQTFSTDRLS